MPYIIKAEIDSLIKKIDECANNPEKYSTAKKFEHITFGYSMSAIWKFDNIGKRHSLYRAEDCIKKFYSSLAEHVANVINFEKKKKLKKGEKKKKMS